jgi:hypothetical protein
MILTTAWFCGPLRAQTSVSLTVPGTSDIFAAGLSSVPNLPAGGGSLPIDLTLNSVPILTFQTTGTIILDNTTPTSQSGPDGGSFQGPTDINSLGGISGIKAPNTGFLVGVFLPAAGQSSNPPPTLDFNTIGTNFTTLAPALGQVFFIGDGLTGTGSGTVQQFIVPNGATNLFLGIADADNVQGPPGHYGDNGGQFNVTVTSVPETSTWVLLLLGLGLVSVLSVAQRREPAHLSFH